MNPWLIVACLLALMGAGAGGFKLGMDHVEAGQAREDKHIQEAVQAASTAAAQAIAKIKVVNTTIQNEVQREVQTNTVYRDCQHSDGGLQLVNKALAAPGPTGDSKLPGSDTPGR